jgi:HK97 family phage major capsid protein
MLHTPPLETKSTDHAAIADVMAAFEEFKAANNQALAELSARQSDVVTTDKLARIERSLDELSLKSARPALGGQAPRSHADLAHKSAFDSYVRQGEAGTLRSLESKALSVASDPDGGYLVPPELEANINRALTNISPIRAIAGVRQVSSATYKRPYATSGLDTGWVGETALRPQTATPTLASITFPTMELYAMPAASSTLLDDSAVNIDQWLAEEVRIAFAAQEGKAFVTGDGINKPKGFLTYDLGLGQGRHHRDRRRGCFPRRRPLRQAHRPHLLGQSRLPRVRHLRHEPRHPECCPQVQGR